MKIGTAVLDRRGESGKISRFYDDFSAIAASCVTITGEEWLAKQDFPFTPEHLTERWAGVRMDSGGSIWSPLSLLTEL